MESAGLLKGVAVGYGRHWVGSPKYTEKRPESLGEQSGASDILLENPEGGDGCHGRLATRNA